MHRPWCPPTAATAAAPMTGNLTQVLPVSAPPEQSLLLLHAAPPELPASTEKPGKEQRAPIQPRPHTQRERTHELPSPPQGVVRLHEAPPERILLNAAYAHRAPAKPSSQKQRGGRPVLLLA